MSNLNSNTSQDFSNEPQSFSFSKHPHQGRPFNFDNHSKSNTLHNKGNVTFLHMNYLIQEVLKPIFNDMNEQLRLTAFTKRSEGLITAASRRKANEPFPELAEYFLMVDELLQQVKMDELSALKVRKISSSIVNQAMDALAGLNSEDSAFSQTRLAIEDCEGSINGLNWHKHLEAHLPPAYQGVKKDGKALRFFLKWYRGKTTNFEIHENNRIDYVNLGMTQAHLRHLDSKLLKSLINANQYNSDFNLDTVIPPLYKKTA